MPAIKVILSDLDGVIRHWNADSLMEKEKEFGLRSGYLYSECFEKELLSLVITGQISDSEWRQRVQKKLSNAIGETSAGELVDAWIKSEVRIDHRILEIYKEHFPGAKLVLATNATSRLNQDMKSHRLDNMFDGILNSSEMGVAKPSHSYFNQAMNELGVGIGEVIYIDDSLGNVQSARQLDIRSHHYQNHARLVEFLAETKSAYFSNSAQT